MSDLNRATILGRIVRDVETRYTKWGKAYCFMTVATERYMKDKKNQTDYHNIMVWGKEGLHEYLTKGTQVYLEGSIQTRKREKDGVDHYQTSIHVAPFDNIILCGKPGGSGNSRGGGRQSREPGEDRDDVGYGTYDPTDDDIPF